LELEEELVNVGDEDTEEESKEYEVEDIIGNQRRKGVDQYLVKWKGFEEPTWESESNLEHLELLMEYKVANRPYYSLRRVNKN